MQADVQLLLGLAILVCAAVLLYARRAHSPAAATPAANPAANAAGVPVAMPDKKSDGRPTHAPATGIDVVRALFPVLVAVFLVRAFVVEPYRIPTGSMIPTLAVGDYVFVSKLAYGVQVPILNRRLITLGEPRLGDVLVFVPPHEQRYFIKRVVGLPGDHVRYVGGELYVNGRRMDLQVDARDDARDGVQRFVEQLDGRRHAIQRFVGMRSREGEWRVPPDRYFTLGDNRDMSEDSRYWGYVAGEQIVGRAFAIWVHKQPGWSWPSFARNGLIE